MTRHLALLALVTLGASASASAVRVGARRTATGVAPPVRSRACGARASAMMGGKAEELDTNGFSQAAQGSVPLLVDVYAHWCGPCQLMAPQLELVLSLIHI